MVLLVPSEPPFDATHLQSIAHARCPVPLHPSTSSCSADSCCVPPSLGVIASCLISTSCVLAVPINSPSLGAIAAQCAFILNDHVVHRSLPSCSPEDTFGSVKSFVSTTLKPARPSVCAVEVRCAVNSCATASSCAACNAASSLNCWISSAVAMTLQPHCP